MNFKDLKTFASVTDMGSLTGAGTFTATLARVKSQARNKIINAHLLFRTLL